MEYKYTGIILSKKDVGETDRLYHIYTLENGKIRVLAKGVRKANAKLAGSLENFTLADITVVKTLGTGKITSSITENIYPHIRKDFDILSGVAKNIALFDSLIEPENREEKLFYLLRDYVETADRAVQNNPGRVKILNTGFTFKLFDFLGYKLNVSTCAFCSQKLLPAKNYFSAEQGGVLCEKCAGSSKGQKISDNAVKLIRLFFRNNIKNLLKINAPEKDIKELSRIEQDFYHWIAK